MDAAPSRSLPLPPLSSPSSLPPLPPLSSLSLSSPPGALQNNDRLAFAAESTAFASLVVLTGSFFASLFPSLRPVLPYLPSSIRQDLFAYLPSKDASYDVVFVDLYSGAQLVPFVSTPTFVHRVKALLTPVGVAAFNMPSADSETTRELLQSAAQHGMQALTVPLADCAAQSVVFLFASRSYEVEAVARGDVTLLIQRLRRFSRRNLYPFELSEGLKLDSATVGVQKMGAKNRPLGLQLGVRPLAVEKMTAPAPVMPPGHTAS